MQCWEALSIPITRNRKPVCCYVFCTFSGHCLNEHCSFSEQQSVKCQGIHCIFDNEVWGFSHPHHYFLLLTIHYMDVRYKISKSCWALHSSLSISKDGADAHSPTKNSRTAHTECRWSFFQSEQTRRASCPQQCPGRRCPGSDSVRQQKRPGVGHECLHHVHNDVLISHDSCRCVWDLAELGSSPPCKMVASSPNMIRYCRTSPSVLVWPPSSCHIHSTFHS